MVIMISDKRMLMLMDLLILQKKIKYNYEFCENIGMMSQTLIKIKNGKQHFTPRHIQAACEKFNVNANWIFAIQNNVFNEKNSIEIKNI